MTQTAQSVLDKFFGGKLGLMVSYMADANKLTAEDVEELHTLLDRLAQEKDDETNEA